jgi:FkbM family methyltransferase
MAKKPNSLLGSLNRLIGFLGYKFQRKSDLHPPVMPYLKSYCIQGKRFSLWIPDSISRDWYDGPEQDWDRVAEIQGLERVAKPGSRVLEIGCHIGFHTMLLAQWIGPQGRICALEASPKHALVAQAQVGLNKLCERVTILNAAASDRTQRLFFRGEHVEPLRTTENIRVQAMRCDDLLKSYGPFDVLKVDVEGYEEAVLKGCGAILKQKPSIALEIHLDLLSRYDSSVSAIFDLIDIGNYHGTMMVRPDWQTLHNFSTGALPSTGVINLFLAPVGK